MSSFDEAPKLPREPTLIRDASLSAAPTTPPPPISAQAPPSPPPFPDAPKSAALPTSLSAQPPSSSTASPRDTAPRVARDAAATEMPLPPSFPSIHDEPAWTSPQSAHTPLSSQLNTTASPLASAAVVNSESSPQQPVHDVAWNRASSDNLSASLSQPTVQPEEVVHEEEKKSMFATILALFKRRKSTAESVESSVPHKPPLQKVKDVVCKLPDPTLIFVLQACVVLLLHTFVPHLLRSWPARIAIPLVLVPTVAATALWRRTIVIAKPGASVLSLVKPIPNAGKVVSMGETLRAREAAVIAAEENVREGHLRLEMLRKEIEARLPPQESITTLLESEQRAQDHS